MRAATRATGAGLLNPPLNRSILPIASHLSAPILPSSVSRSVEARLEATDAYSPEGPRNALRLVARMLADIASTPAEEPVKAPGLPAGSSMELERLVASLCTGACEGVLAQGPDGRAELVKEGLLAELLHMLATGGKFLNRSVQQFSTLIF